MQLNEGSLCDNFRAYGDLFGHILVGFELFPAASTAQAVRAIRAL